MIELVIVIIIIGTAAAIAVPRFAASGARYRLDAATQRLVNDLEWGRGLARHESREIHIKFEDEFERYTFMDQPDPDRPDSTEYIVQLDEPPYEVEMHEAGFGSGNGAKTEFSFNPWGAPVKHNDGKQLPGDGIIELRLGGLTRTIHIDRDTGRITTP